MMISDKLVEARKVFMAVVVVDARKT